MADSALTIVIWRRFVKFLFRVANRTPKAVSDSDTIEDLTGFTADDVVDLQVRRRLDDDDTLGMGDVLASNFAPGEFRTGTTLARGVGIVSSRVTLQTHGQYKAVLQLRMRKDFRQIVATIANVDVSAVRDERPVDEIVSAQERDRMISDCATAFDKFLLTKLDGDELKGTVREHVDTLVSLMVVR